MSTHEIVHRVESASVFVIIAMSAVSAFVTFLLLFVILD